MRSATDERMSARTLLLRFAPSVPSLRTFSHASHSPSQPRQVRLWPSVSAWFGEVVQVVSPTTVPIGIQIEAAESFSNTDVNFVPGTRASDKACVAAQDLLNCALQVDDARNRHEGRDAAPISANELNALVHVTRAPIVTSNQQRRQPDLYSPSKRCRPGRLRGSRFPA